MILVTGLLYPGILIRLFIYFLFYLFFLGGGDLYISSISNKTLIWLSFMFFTPGYVLSTYRTQFESKMDKMSNVDDNAFHHNLKMAIEFCQQAFSSNIVNFKPLSKPEKHIWNYSSSKQNDRTNHLNNTHDQFTKYWFYYLEFSFYISFMKKWVLLSIST